MGDAGSLDYGSHTRKGASEHWGPFLGAVMMRMKYSGYMEGQRVSWKIDISPSSWFNTEAALAVRVLKKLVWCLASRARSQPVEGLRTLHLFLYKEKDRLTLNPT